MLLLVVFIYVLVNLLAFVTVLVSVDGAEEHLNNICNKGAEEIGVSPTLYFTLYLLACCIVFVPTLTYYFVKR